MPDRKPEPWASGAAVPFLWIEGSPVEVWALGGDRFAVTAPGTSRSSPDLRRRSRRRTHSPSGSSGGRREALHRLAGPPAGAAPRYRDCGIR
jgi:hypothetical protein